MTSSLTIWPPLAIFFAIWSRSSALYLTHTPKIKLKKKEKNAQKKDKKTVCPLVSV